MSTTTTSSRPSYIQWLIESRPPSLTWSRSSPPQTNQPPLDLIDDKPDVGEAQRRITEASGSAWSRHAGPPISGPGLPMPESGAPHLHWL